MQLGFVSAIVADLGLREVLQTAKEIGYETVEIMCWPVGKAERRYAGVTHIDVDGFDESRAAEINALADEIGVGISGLGYYPNPLAPDPAERAVAIEHLSKVMVAANKLGLKNVNTFIGRDPSKMIDDNWPEFLQVWRPLVELAEALDIKIGIENCPMLFSKDEWPGGKNLAIAPGDLAPHVQRYPQPEFRPQLRPLAPGLADDRHGRAAPGVQGPNLPRACQGRPPGS